MDLQSELTTVKDGFFEGISFPFEICLSLFPRRQQIRQNRRQYPFPQMLFYKAI